MIKNMFIADPAGLVYNDAFYLYTGHDEQAEGTNGFLMNDWSVFSSTDMVTWENHGPRPKASDFGQAWAAHVVERDGKFYCYATVEHATITGKSIGVTVGDSPIGLFTDVPGKVSITNSMTTHTDIGWDDINPAVFIENGGAPYLYWGNAAYNWVKLKDNMPGLDGEIHTPDLPLFTEVLWVHKREDDYYLSFAAQFPEVIDYAMTKKPEGTCVYKGRLNDQEVVNSEGQFA